MKNQCICDICEHEMPVVKELCEFSFEGERYHAEAMVFHCSCCGYRKLADCEVMFYENDTPPTPQGTCLPVPAQKMRQNPPMFCLEDGKAVISDQWLDWMLDEKSWFLWIYDNFASKELKQKRYLKKHMPQFKAIINDVLYDTDRAEMFLQSEKAISSKEILRSYNYMTCTGKYFRIITRYGYPDELTTLTLKEVKLLLAKEPDIYRKVISDEVEE